LIFWEINEIMKYSSGLMSHSFWFLETKKTAKLIIEGLTKEEILQKSLEDNIYQVDSQRRKKRITNALYKRLNGFSKEALELFLNSSNETAKIFVLISIMKTDKLFFEFMYEVFRDHLIINDTSLKDSEFNIFFQNKKIQDEKISNWKETTFKRLKSTYILILSEAGVLKTDTKDREIVPPFIDFKMKDYLINNDMAPFVYAVTGEQ
jgi:hypothetical protein